MGGCKGVQEDSGRSEDGNSEGDAEASACDAGKESKKKLGARKDPAGPRKRASRS